MTVTDIRQAKIAVIIPAYNEAETIESVIAEAARYSPAAIIVVDDASSDGTADSARNAGANVLILHQRLGAWGAVQTGIRYALNKSIDFAVTMDADGQHEARYLGQLLKPIMAGEADMVIGAHPQRVSQARKIAWSWFRLLSGLKVQDITSGFRAYNHSAMCIMAKDIATLLDYQDVGVLLMLRNSGHRIIETQVGMLPRSSGKSRVFSSWVIVARYMLHTSLLCLARLNRPADSRESL